MGEKSGEQSQSPQVVPGFEFLPEQIQQLLGLGQQQFQGATGQGIGGQEQQFLSALQGLDIPGLLGQGFGQLQNIASGGLADAAAPGLERLLNVGSANLNEQAALSGTLSGTGASQNQADFTANAVAQLQQTLAPLQLQAAQGLAGPGTAQLGGQAFGKEREIGNQQAQQELGAFQQSQALLPGLLSGAGAASSGVPIFQPTTGPGKTESLFQVAAPLAGAAIGGPPGAKAGSAVAGGASGGGKGAGGGK